MNYNYSGQFGNPRRRTPPSIPETKHPARETFLSRSDLSPTDRNEYNGTHSEGSHHSGDQSHRSLAMVYSPIQRFSALYDEETALARGTLFSELDLPFYGKTCGKERR